MTVEVARDVLSATGSPMLARPVAFDGLFGWLHPGVTRRGVVLCGTLGFEQLSAYRAWRALAEDIAAAGCPCLRFDYPGEGDSGDAGAGDVAELVGSIRRAIRFLRDEADVEEIVLVGLRLGGMLAALAAQEGGVDRVVLLAPFASGRAYLREMQMQARTIVIWPGGVPLRPEPGTLNVNGFILSQTFMADIEAIGKDIYSKIAARHVMFVEQTSSKSVSSDRSSGPAIKRETFAHFSKLLSGEMNFRPVSDVIANTKPLNAIVTNFLMDDNRTVGARLYAGNPNGRIRGPGWEENPISFGDGLFGIMCRPHAVPIRNCSVLFVNSGTYVRSGSSRHTARLARDLAARGVSSFRIDLRGTGDSADCPRRSVPLYNLETLADVKSALDTLQRSSDAPVVVVGLCSGAYLGFHAACGDERVTDAILINLYCFDWPADANVQDVIGRPTVHGATTYAKSLTSINTWRRILSGKVSVSLIFLGLLKLWSKTLSKRWSVFWSTRNAASTIIHRVADLRGRGGSLTFVYSADDPGISNVQSELGMSIVKIARIFKCKFETIDHCDHNLSTPKSHARIKAIIHEKIDDRLQ